MFDWFQFIITWIYVYLLWVMINFDSIGWIWPEAYSFLNTQPCIKMYQSPKSLLLKITIYNVTVCTENFIFIANIHITNNIIYSLKLKRLPIVGHSWPLVHHIPHYKNNYLITSSQENYENVSNRPQEEKIWGQAVTHVDESTRILQN